jgi:ADP-ribose pyrophosphatase
MTGRFRLTMRRLAAANTKFEIFFDRLEGPNGIVVPEYLMVCPKVLLRQAVSGVCVLPEVDGRIGLMRSHRHQFDEYVWQAPAGFVEPDETADFSALRELQEEAGLACRPERLVSLGLMMPDAGIVQSRVALFVARDARPIASGDRGADEPGLGEMVYFTPDELGALVQTSADMGASTMIACCRYLTRFHMAAISAR